MSSKPRNIVILTGAGISAESGLSTFRAQGGLWDNHRIEDVATPEGFARNPSLVHRFYNERRAQLGTVAPNAAHHALAELEAQWQGDFLLVTQNVDNLHDRAGSGSTAATRGCHTFVHMHGELTRAECTLCTSIHDWHDALSTETPCPACARAGGMRPRIVWFGEMPLHMELIYDRLRNADLFVAIGTSGNVYPAAGFVFEAKEQAGAHTIEVNLEPSEVNRYFDEHRHGPAGTLVPQLVTELLRD